MSMMTSGTLLSDFVVESKKSGQFGNTSVKNEFGFSTIMMHKLQ